ncbi:3-hydroxyisobutyrate dehydrogenase [Cyphellophora europaea CBS 101466]|uniref:3-hydroxyisobutyrate dehydrogenase n=1 Tax=Cyphellophora europaea (strain CBS 101466) TaxID=1220924 RepID=W2S100_CYPE1|nr:3-hydroxyisobutyrate dehydrogenase [Cyphellophora europaea CBS 101466]ETN41644.1 3-hydroxyisobutyrate dehydrogenase [Cyphellophora europaea CBS 101466]
MTVLRTTSTLRRGLQTSLLASRQFSTTVRRDAAWGFIGLGAMGYPMAKNLRAKIPEDDTMTVFDVNAAALERFAKEAEPNNVTVAKAPREVVENSDHIISALPEPQHVKGVFGDVFASKLPSPPSESSRIFIDCSTIDPTTSRSVATQVTEHGDADFVDAPMSGGVVGARAGTLTFMVGADEKLVKRVETILMLMGKKVWHMGPQGTGLSGKLANNYALAINNIGAAEAMNLGIKWGIKPKALADLINSATGKSWPSEINNPVPGVLENSPSSRDYEGGFGVSLMKKDLRLAMTAAEEADAKLVLADKAKEVYEETEKAHKGKDFSVVYQWLTGKS